MKIEKVNDNQIKFILCKEELEERGINIEYIKSQNVNLGPLLAPLIEEIRQESLRIGFFLQDTHHIVELVPRSFDELIVLVTKTENKQKVITTPNFKSIKKSHNEANYTSYPKEEPQIRREAREARRIRNIYIYTFAKLDDVIEISTLVKGYFLGYSKVYKYMEEYFLVMEGRLGEEGASFLMEHGTRVENLKIEATLKEHGEVIISKDAISKLSSL